MGKAVKAKAAAKTPAAKTPTAKAPAAKASAASAPAAKAPAASAPAVKRKVVKPIPEGQHSVTPYLVVRGATDAIDLYRKAFGAVNRGSMPGPDGKIVHAELQIGDAFIYLSDEMPGGNCREALEMADCTSCAAASMLRLSENWMVICVRPKALTDVIESTPAMVVN